ncbi:hypothetical protein CHU_3573 [Sporocytophaga myxococcoides]|uniref:Uncharacterized protein n=1 Tax=Sporocytophaga myxococcoides TaxID=153721 RepID=A0A098LGM6_9BACT|nr:hypothetical protein [Sporocytophaga myxococcoides]GAL85614.1 hypothetical protein CHU_3573 [Sporocytophaga myxococcoides]
MKQYKHHAIIITTRHRKLINELRLKAKEFFIKDMQAKTGPTLIGEITPSIIGEFYTMVIFPDGSKEGYETSEEADNIRCKIVLAIKELNQKAGNQELSFVEVTYGSDNEPAAILNTN